MRTESSLCFQLIYVIRAKLTLLKKISAVFRDCLLRSVSISYLSNKSAKVCKWNFSLSKKKKKQVSMNTLCAIQAKFFFFLSYVDRQRKTCKVDITRKQATTAKGDKMTKWLVNSH